jgi:hypothetical protein
MTTFTRSIKSIEKQPLMDQTADDLTIWAVLGCALLLALEVLNLKHEALGKLEARANKMRRPSEGISAACARFIEGMIEKEERRMRLCGVLIVNLQRHWYVRHKV